MTLCCTSSNNTHSKAACPVNGQLYPQIRRRTVLHQIRQPWQQALTAEHYYFCDDPNCDVVYFSNDQQIIVQSELRQPVGQKSTAADKPVCYCFDILLADLQTARDQIALKAFITEQTKNSACDCEIRNPSGKCCLKDFPK